VRTADNQGAFVFNQRTGASSYAEAMRIDSSGRLLVGTSSSRIIGGTVGSKMQIEYAGGSGFNGLSVSATDGGATVYINNASSSTIANGALIGRLGFTGYDGTDTANEFARIEAYADSGVSNNDTPGRLVFSTTADGASSVTERLRIDSSGQLIHTGLRAGGGDNKLAILSTLSHNTNEEKVAVYISENESSSNQLTFGGGSSSYNAVTTLRFMTASAVDTTTGTERLRIDSNGNFIFKNGALIENGFHDNGGGLNGDYNHDLGTYGNVHFSSTNAAGTFTYNLRINSSATLNSVMSEGDVLSFTLMHASNNTSYYLTQLKIDGSDVSPVWAGGSAPSAATGSGFDVYSFSIMKTGSNAYGIFGTFTNHA
jgi:hypothetical protein